MILTSIYSKYHRFVLLKPDLGSNALQATLCCSHSWHSPRYHFPWGCPKIKGSSREQEGRLENNIRYFPSKLKLHGINDSRVHRCFSQREGSFLAYCILRKLFKLFSFHMDLLKSGCRKAAVLQIGIAFFLERSPTSLEASGKHQLMLGLA